MSKKASLVAVVLFVGLCVSAAPACATTLGWEYFDTDPGWVESGNRDGGCDFGYSDTNLAGGYNNGEMGGLVKRTDVGSARYYGYNESTPLTLNEALEINWNSANAAKMGFNHNAELTEDNPQFGFFDRSTVGTWSNTRFMGVRINDDELYLSVMCGSGLNTDLLIKGGMALAGNFGLRLKYDPTAGSNGVVTAQYNNEAAKSISLSSGQRSSGQTFNTLGMFAIGAGASTSYLADGVSFYADNLYATGLTGSEQVPEPASIVLVLVGMFGMAAYAWRKRR